MQVQFSIADEPDARALEKGRMLFAGETLFVKAYPLLTEWKFVLQAARTSGNLHL